MTFGNIVDFSAIALTITAVLIVGYCSREITETKIADHVLSKSSTDPHAKDAVEFQASYCSYLATLTGAIIVGLFVFLQTSGVANAQRVSAGIAIACFVIALVIVTIGYAIRAQWFVQAAKLSERMVWWDYRVNGPLCALLYTVGAFALVHFVIRNFVKET